jgi:sugar lactone lactonase YvrE
MTTPLLLLALAVAQSSGRSPSPALPAPDTAASATRLSTLGPAQLADGSRLVVDDPVNRIRLVAYHGHRIGTGAGGAQPTKVAELREGLARPESARWDPDQRVWFISNINGAQEKDDNGYISRVAADGRMQRARFVAGGSDGAALHAPKGLAISGDTLWVTDLDAVRGFHRRTGAPIASIDLASLGALFLNDITVGPDGSLYVTDTGVRFDSAGTRVHVGPDRVFRIQGRSPSVVLEGDVLGEPNGIAWDAARRRFLLGPIAGAKAVLAWGGPGTEPVPIARGPGRYDGIEVLPDGRTLVSAWNDSTVSEIAGDRLRPLIRGVSAAADIGVDPRAGIVAVPLLREDRVEFWKLE